MLQLSFAFDVVLIQRNAIYRADLLALRLVVMADALGAQVRVDDVNFFALRDRSVRALRLADVAVNAVVGDDQGHGATPAQVRGLSMQKTDAQLCRIVGVGAIDGGVQDRRREAVSLAFEAFGEGLGDCWMDKFADVAVQRSNFAHQRRGDIRILF